MDEPDDVLEEHALAGARGPEQRHGLALLDREVDAVEHHLLAEPLPHLPELDHQLSSTLARSMLRSRITTELATTAAVVGAAHSLGSLLGVESHVAGNQADGARRTQNALMTE